MRGKKFIVRFCNRLKHFELDLQLEMFTCQETLDNFIYLYIFLSRIDFIIFILYVVHK